MNGLKQYFHQYKARIFLGQLFKLAEAVLELFIPLVMASLIDHGVAKGDASVIWQKGGLMVLLALIGVGAALVCQVMASRVSIAFETELRQDLFDKISRLSVGQLDRLGTPSLTARLTSDLYILRDAFAMLMRLVPRAPFLGIGSVVMAVALDIRLSAVFLVTTPLIILTVWIILRAVAPRFRQIQAMLDKIARLTREALSGVRVIRAFSKERQINQRFRNTASAYAETVAGTGRLSALLSPLTGMMMNAGLLCVLYFGGFRVRDGLPVGILVAFISYLLNILQQTAVASNLFALYTRAYASAKRVGEILDLRPDVADTRWTEEPVDKTQPLLQFENVSFAYPDGAEALSRVSFTLNRGETLGVIGGTGAGKSTLLHLILRLSDPTEGRILLYGQELKKWPLKDLRALLSCVPQQTELLTGSIRDNLYAADPDASDARLNDALHCAHAPFAIEKGLDAPIAEGGVSLSGGQKQRLAIARCVLKRADLYLFDDAFSALDFKTEAQVRANLLKRQQSSAYVFVSQRAFTIRNASRILVLDQGRVSGIGTHEDLMRGCPVYREIWQSQNEGGQA